MSQWQWDYESGKWSKKGEKLYQEKASLNNNENAIKNVSQAESREGQDNSIQEISRSERRFKEPVYESSWTTKS